MTLPSLAGHDDHRRWLALAVCLAGGFIVFLDVSIVNVALPTISVHLHTSGSGLQWIVSGYALAFGLLLVPSGRVGDIHGHRMLFVAGLAVFVAASAVCGAAPSVAVLVFGRIVQGAAGGVLTPQIDWRQARHASDDKALLNGEAPDDPNVPARDIPDRR
jgi:MFS family permease